MGETEGTRYDGLNDIPITPRPACITPVVPPSNLPTPGYLPETAQRVQHHQKLNEIQVSSFAHFRDDKIYEIVLGPFCATQSKVG